MPHLDTLSFFVFVLLICPAIFVALWNTGFTKKLRYGDGLRFVLVWMLFSVVVMVMNQIGRETLDPGRWPRERLFYGVTDSHLIGSDAVVQNLLFGWVLFPLRVFPKVQFYGPAIATGIVATLFALILVHLVGKQIISRHWKSGWSFSVIGFLLMLYVTSFVTVGLVRQIAWIFTQTWRDATVSLFFIPVIQ